MKLIALYKQPPDPQAFEASMKNAMRSPEMTAAGENLNSFAAGLVTWMYGVERDGVS